MRYLRSISALARRGWIAGGCLAVAAGLSAWSARSGADEPWRATEEQRRERLQTMDAAEKETLERQVERFNSLSETEREQLRKIHADFSQAPDGDRLYAVLQHYCEWLKTLNAAERADLASLTADKRIELMKTFMANQERDRALSLAELSYEEILVVLKWLDGIVHPREEEFLAHLHPEGQKFFREHFQREKTDSTSRSKSIIFWLFRDQKWDKVQDIVNPAPADLKRLLASLSEPTRTAYEKLNDPEKQRETVRKWIVGAVFKPTYAPVSDNELHKFFTRLPKEQQANLELLPRDEMHRKLRQLYFASRFGGPGWGGGGEGGPGGRPPFRGPGQFPFEGPGHNRPGENRPFAKPPGG